MSAPDDAPEPAPKKSLLRMGRLHMWSRTAVAMFVPPKSWFQSVKFSHFGSSGIPSGTSASS